jgi:NAD(P)H-hydrate epimerase
MDKVSLDARLFQVQGIRAIVERAAEEASLTSSMIMGRAGQAAWDTIDHHFPHIHSIGIFCGPGANGSDGLYLAALAAQAGKHVTCFTVGDPTEATENHQRAYALAEAANVYFVEAAQVIHEDTELVIDALLGLGYTGDFDEVMELCTTLINEHQAPVCSLDIPTGLNANSGAAMMGAVHADLTISYIAPKFGCYTYQGPRVCGKLITHHLGIDPKIIEAEKPVATLLTERFVRQALPKRQKDSHKGDYGHVLVVGGDYGMGGAVRMAAEAAMRTGAGSVAVATRPEHLNVVSGARPEIMCYEVRTAEDVLELAKKAKVIVLGPGLGQTDWARGLFDALVQVDKPKVLDADALHLLSETDLKRDDWILTPHPGEAAQLLQQTCPDIQTQRLRSVKNIQKRYGGVSVLKGRGSLVDDGKHIRLCHAGNPGMATAGMGDILSGVIGGLLAQGLSLPQSAGVGVLVHARSADMAVQETGERGLLATDLLPFLRVLVNP